MPSDGDFLMPPMWEGLEHANEHAKSEFAAYDSVIETGRPPLRTRLGFHDLDELTGGFGPGDLIVVGGRPSVGKTSFLQEIVLNVARGLGAAEGPGAVAYFSMESRGNRLTKRLACMLAGISEKEMLSVPNAATYRNFGDAISALMEMPIFIDPSSVVTPEQVRKRCAALAEKQPISLVAIDSLHLMRSDERAESRVQEVSDVARSLKATAKDLGLPLLVTSEVNRLSDQREDKRPRLSDLRDAGTIEAVADAVIFLHRDSLGRHTDAPSVELCEAILAKHRHGPVGVVHLAFQHVVARLRNVARQMDDDAR